MKASGKSWGLADSVIDPVPGDSMVASVETLADNASVISAEVPRVLFTVSVAVSASTNDAVAARVFDD